MVNSYVSDLFFGFKHDAIDDYWSSLESDECWDETMLREHVADAAETFLENFAHILPIEKSDAPALVRDYMRRL